MEYDPGSGKTQNVWTKAWTSSENSDILEMRKTAGIKSLAEAIAEAPGRLAAYTPASLKSALEAEGMTVQALMKGSLKNIPFENGGGYKVNFGGNGLLQYHPEASSHHGGAYYKISTSEKGTIRYDLEGRKLSK